MDRTLAIIDYLRGRGRTTTADLAAHLGVSERTVRRDLVWLQAQGVHIETEPGRHGGLRLTRGALLPALRFTDDEALVLALGLRLAQQHGSGGLSRAAVSALRRLEHVLSPKQGRRIEALMATVTASDTSPWNLTRVDSETLLALSEAAQGRVRLRLRYRTAQGHGAVRDFDPYAVVPLVDYWYVAGYCHLRRDLRTFRVDRLTVLETLKATFDAPAGFDALETVSRAVARTPHVNHEPCRMWIGADEATVRAWLPRHRAAVRPDGDGVLVEMQAEPRRYRQIATGLLGLGVPAQVLSPSGLRDVLAEVAAQASAIAHGGRTG